MGGYLKFPKMGVFSLSRFFGGVRKIFLLLRPFHCFLSMKSMTAQKCFTGDGDVTALSLIHLDTVAPRN